MFNLVVGGDCKDGYGFSIEINYYVEYLYANVTSNTTTTSNKKLLFNTNDITHLGYMGALPIGTPLYVIGWQGDINKVNPIRECRKRYIVGNEPVIIKDVILDENKYVNTNIQYSVDNDSNYIIDPVVSTNDVLHDVTYYVYYNSGSILSDTNEDWKLVETIVKDSDDTVTMLFKEAGSFKILCEALIDNNEVSEQSTLLLLISKGIPSISGRRYIEWE